MKEKIKSDISAFSRTFVMAVMVLILPVCVVYAVTVADGTTRRIGYDDSTPSVYISKVENGYEISFFGNTATVSDTTVSTISKFADYAKKIIPAPVRAGAGIIESLAALTLHAAESAGL